MVSSTDIKPVAEALIKAVRPVSIYLFGSVARTGQGNDLDLLVIHRDDQDNADALRNVNRTLQPFYKSFDVDPFVIPAGKVRRFAEAGSPFLRSVMKEGRLLYMTGIVDEWRKQAVEELSAAQYLATGGFFRGSCYHAQQAIEKRIKSELLNAGWELEKTHSLRRLIALGEKFGLIFDIPETDVEFIDNMCRGRSPAEAGLLPLGEPNAEDAGRACAIGASLVK